MEDVKSTTEQAIDARLGIGRKAYGFGWWALALWTSASSINVLARMQNWGFHLPFGADFKDVSTGYGVAAYGVFGGGIPLWVVLAGLIVHLQNWGRLAHHWPGRIPAAWESISGEASGPIPWLLQLVVVAMAVVIPIILQLLFVAKFFAGTAISGSDHRVGLQHLLWPPNPVLSYVYDGRCGFSYCEFFEPLGAVLVAAISLFVGIYAILLAAQTRGQTEAGDATLS